MTDIPACRYVVLANQGLLAVKGSDSAQFLQGQLTCDVYEATAQRAVNGAYCTPKGNIIGVFQLLKVDDLSLIHI